MIIACFYYFVKVYKLIILLFFDVVYICYIHFILLVFLCLHKFDNKLEENVDISNPQIGLIFNFFSQKSNE